MCDDVMWAWGVGRLFFFSLVVDALSKITVNVMEKMAPLLLETCVAVCLRYQNNIDVIETKLKQAGTRRTHDDPR
jgi:hypothetical protein